MKCQQTKCPMGKITGRQNVRRHKVRGSYRKKVLTIELLLQGEKEKKKYGKTMGYLSLGGI